MEKGKVDVLLGLQWGDEGKGKVVDVLTPRYDVVARFQGGPNAGHTLEFQGQKYVLRSIPSGIFQGGKVNIIGNGYNTAEIVKATRSVVNTHNIGNGLRRKSRSSGHLPCYRPLVGKRGEERHQPTHRLY